MKGINIVPVSLAWLIQSWSFSQVYKLLMEETVACVHSDMGSTLYYNTFTCQSLLGCFSYTMSFEHHCNTSVTAAPLINSEDRAACKC